MNQKNENKTFVTATWFQCLGFKLLWFGRLSRQYVSRKTLYIYKLK